MREGQPPYSLDRSFFDSLSPQSSWSMKDVLVPKACVGLSSYDEFLRLVVRDDYCLLSVQA